MRKLVEAVPERNEHQDDLQQFEKSLTSWDLSQLADWKRAMETWENDMSQPNPFQVKSECKLVQLSSITFTSL